MADEITTNYGFVLPNNDSFMSDPVKYINNNLVKLEDIPAPTSITGNLPTSGSYDLYDRIYRTNDQSIYLLVVKSADWGYVWRPVHTFISPWQDVPLTAYFDNTQWTHGTSPNTPQIALDNRGRIYWRGAVKFVSGAIPRNTSYRLFKDLPPGLAPSRTNTFACGIDLVTLGASGLGMWQGGRIYMEAPDTNNLGVNPRYTSARVYGGSANAPTQLHLNMIYYVGEKAYYGT